MGCGSSKEVDSSDLDCKVANFNQSGLSSKSTSQQDLKENGSHPGAETSIEKNAGNSAEDGKEGGLASPFKSPKREKNELNATARLMNLRSQMVQRSSSGSFSLESKPSLDDAGKQKVVRDLEEQQDMSASQRKAAVEGSIGILAGDQMMGLDTVRSLERSVSTVPVQPEHSVSVVGIYGAGGAQMAGPLVRAITGRKSKAGPKPPDESEIRGVLDLLMKDLPAEEQQIGAGQLRVWSKVSREHREALGNCGAVLVLVKLLQSEDEVVVEHAVTTLLNLGLEATLKSEIGRVGVIPKLLDLMVSSQVKKIRENAAGALSNLSVDEQNRPILRDAGIIHPMAELLSPDEDLLVRRDAAIGLFNMAIDAVGKEDIVNVGMVKILAEILDEPNVPLEEEAVMLLASLMKLPKACDELETMDGLNLLVGVLDGGSPRAQTWAVSALLLYVESSEDRRDEVMKEGIIPTLNAISEGGTVRGREKSAALLKLLRTA